MVPKDASNSRTPVVRRLNQWHGWFVKMFGRRVASSPQGARPSPDADQWWPALAAGVEASADGEGLALLDTLTGRLFVSNQVAASIWLGASKGLSLDEVAEEIAMRFGVARERAKLDIQAFVGLLERHGLAKAVR